MTQENTEAVGLGSLVAETRALIDEQGKPTLQPVVLDTGDTAYVELSKDNGTTVLNPKDFDAWRRNPLFREDKARLTSLAGLIDYTVRFRDADSVVFANDDRNNPSITTVLDYHRAGEAGVAEARFGRHEARYSVPLSDEWKAWHENNAASLTMANFARFLEDHIIDVLPAGAVNLSEEQRRFVETLGGTKRVADPAKLMELATGMQVFEEGEVTQATKLQSGEGKIIVENRHTDGQGGELTIPSLFVIAIPVFRGGDPYAIVVRLRYRKTAQGILFFYELWRDDRVFDHAFDEMVAQIEAETSLSVFRGSRS